VNVLALLKLYEYHGVFIKGTYVAEYSIIVSSDGLKLFA